MYGCHGGSSSIRGLQYVGNRFQSWGTGLLVPIYSSEIGCGKVKLAGLLGWKSLGHGSCWLFSPTSLTGSRRKRERGMANILCVDDEPAALALKKTILVRAGHAVTTSRSANEAIALLQKETFDAVVTDWNLGEENGRQILLAAKTGVQV